MKSIRRGVLGSIKSWQRGWSFSRVGVRYYTHSRTGWGNGARYNSLSWPRLVSFTYLE